MPIAQPAPRPTTREERALALYQAHGTEIRHLSGAIYRVPSEAEDGGQRSYDVEYGVHERCACPDHLYRGSSCVHILALAIAIAKGAIRHPEVAVGDPFIVGGKNRPCACDGGWATVGYLVEDENGEEVEEFAQYLCRCQAKD